MDIVEGMELEKKAASQGTPVFLSQLLLRHRPSLATDPKDKTFALLGLCTDSIVQADYRLSTSEAYRLLTQAYLRRQSSLDIITAPSSPGSTQRNTTSSWVPDWSATDVAFPLALRGQLVSETDYQATGRKLGDVRQPYRPDKPTLKALYKHLRVEFVVAYGWQKICLGEAPKWTDPYPATGESLFDVSWQILLAGCSSTEYDACRDQSMRIWKMFRWYLFARRLHLLPLWVFKLIDGITTVTGRRGPYRILSEAITNDFQFRVRRVISHRRIMRSRGGYLGLVPALTRVGDRIALLKGMSTPAVLRPMRGDEWEFVGDCYVHGTMNGEAFRPDDCREIWLA
ncbi:hypothetical protein K431DRAFT_307549 [Polychaeton citri CBS 116435]|uniref:Heterokaryon incompatibility domain-containing protein n=1 Tax=Polychaeton citri CBS 116435 TaxID=1314669 RepID=A0A9P4Q288_9PEZI|nr:hypothetical protein K431DRAFT_307549 [Polychaeton citri CBS 116435]